MASTTGFVNSIGWVPLGPWVCVWIGPTPTSNELFVISFGAGDSEWLLAFKRSMARLLAMAWAFGCEVTVEHPDTSGEILNVSVGGFNICPVDQPVHGDAYCVTGSAIPADVQVVFDSGVGRVTVTPDLVRPNWLVIRELPLIATGLNRITLEAAGWSSDAVPVQVSAGPAPLVRVLNPGAPNLQAYTIVLVGNPVIQGASSDLRVDPVMTARRDFQRTVGYCLTNLLSEAEDVLRQDNIDKHIRFVTIFDSTLVTSDQHSLVGEDTTNIVFPRFPQQRNFPHRYFVSHDVSVIITGSTTHSRESSTATVDDPNGPATPFNCDFLINQSHPHFPVTPGAVALHTDIWPFTLTALHEFLHAASSVQYGWIVDLYFDGSPADGIPINKRWRANAGDPIPATFGSYNGSTYASDPNRDGIGYGPGWLSYHAALIDPARPNIMDETWSLADRLDHVTHDWLSDRLRAKIFR